MDNCGPHGTDLVDIRVQVQLFTLPPNCTALHQPMDLGIISAWKIYYRSMLFREIVKDLETRQERRDATSVLVRGMRGLAEGHEPHMLDVASLSNLAWQKVTDVTIARCWLKSKSLPAGQVAAVSYTHLTLPTILLV